MRSRITQFIVIFIVLCLPLVTSAQSTIECTLRVIGDSRLNVRQEPSVNSALVRIIEPSETIVTTDKFDAPDGSWYAVDGGWIAAWLVEPNGTALDGYYVVKLAGSPYTGAFDLEVDGHSYVGTVCPEVIHGTEENDFLFGRDGDDVLIGYGGNDTLSGDLGDDVLFGGSGDDLLYGSQGFNYIYAMAGADRVFSFTSQDDIFLLDGFAPHRNITANQVNEWFGGDVIDRLFAPTTTAGDLVVSRYFIFLDQSQSE